MKRASLFLVFVGFSGILSAQGLDIRRGKIVKLDIDNYAITLKSGDKDLDLVMAEETNVLNSKGKSLKERLGGFKVGAEVQFVAQQKDGKYRLTHIRLFNDKEPRPNPVKIDSSKLVPLNELGDTKYNSYTGGFYPDGKNERPRAHEEAGLRFAKEVLPRDTEGKPDAKGKIILLSVGMSNTSQASQGFARALASTEGKNPALRFVNGAMGGMTAARIQDPNNADGAKYWGNIDQQLKAVGATQAQVQVVWIKQADAGPSAGFPKYALKLEEELGTIVRILPKRFPNLQLVYLSSRTYGGYATTGLNPEPYAYESAFSVKWLIEKQIKGDAELNFDAKKGEVKAPWLSWGPYLWANGSKKRPDGFYYEQGDFTANDGTHLTPAGQDKIGRLMVRFFESDTASRSWFKPGKE